MGKYNIGVGDAFPADEAPPPPRPEDGDRHDPRSCGHRMRHHRYGGHRNWPFQVAFLLAGIWAVISLFVHGHGPHGLLIAAGIMVVIGLANHLFGGRRRRDRQDDRRPWREARDARDRRWEDR